MSLVRWVALEDTEACQEVARLRNVVSDLKAREVGYRHDAARAAAERERMEDELRELRAGISEEGAATVTEVARLRAQVERVEAIHAPVRVYDECEHDSDHGCEPVELYDYRGCSESAIGWGCSVCCYDDEHPRENCPHGADHHGVTKADACPTVAALRGDDR